MFFLKLFDRYLFSVFLRSFFYVLLLMIGIIFIFSLLSELRSLNQGEYGFYPMLCYVFLKLPGGVYQFFPLILLLSCLWGVSQLAQHHEILVMQTLGWSKLRILSSMMAIGFFMTFIMTFLGEIWIPGLNYRAAVLREMSQHGEQAAITNQGVWFRFDNQFVHIEQILNRSWLSHVMIYELDQQAIRQIIVADQALKQGKQWQLKKVSVLHFFPTRITQENFEQAPWNIHFSPQLLQLGLVDPEEMSLQRLRRFSQYLQMNAQRSDEYDYPFWQRLMKPALGLVMLLSALPFLFKLGRRTAYGWQLLRGLIIGVLFYLVNTFLSQVAMVWQWQAWLAACFPPMIFLVITLVVLWRLRVLK